MVLADNICQVQRQSVENLVGCNTDTGATLAQDAHHLHTLHLVALALEGQWDTQAGRLEKMQVQALLSSKVMVCSAFCCTSISSSVTPAGICQKYYQIYLLVVCISGKPLAVVNTSMVMLRALVSEVLRPTKRKNVAHLVKNTMFFFKSPAFWPPCLVWHIFLEHYKHFH